MIHFGVARPPRTIVAVVEWAIRDLGPQGMLLLGFNQ